MIARDQKQPYVAMVSTDWNECLSPMGPFDPIIFTYPNLKSDLRSIFRYYTGNKITLTEAVERLKELMPEPLTQKQMDAYLEKHFVTYNGVPEFIEWCNENKIFFMINTTASIGFFQRVFIKGLLPMISALSAHPGIRYDTSKTDPEQVYELLEITDKYRNTQKAAQLQHIPYEKIIIIGDSGGDGPHFEWGASVGAFLIGSMTKWSLETFCEKRGIYINLYLGPRYGESEMRDEVKEMETNFSDLRNVVEGILTR